MEFTYFDVKRELKKIYQLAHRALKKDDAKSINFLLSQLDQLSEKLNGNTDIDSFGHHVLNKDVEHIKYILMKKKKGAANEQESTGSIS